MVGIVGALCVLPAVALAVPPANDDFADAEFLTGDAVVAIGSTVEATSEAGEPVHGGDSLGTSVWFRWRAERSGIVSLDCLSGSGARIAVYSGSALGGLGELVSYRFDPCDWPVVHFRAAAGVEYRIAVDDASTPGAFSFELKIDSAAPPNDDFSAAIPFTERGRNDTVSGTTEGASREPGEPSHGGWSLGSSIWFRWTAEYDGAARIYACGGGFHPVIAAYTAATLGTLAPVGVPTQAGVTERGCTLAGAPALALTAVAGQTYWVAVDGADGAWGRVTLVALDSPPPPSSARAWIGKRIRIRRGLANIRFDADYFEASFECRLDRRRFRSCESPVVYRNLRRGRHRFAVRANGQPGSASTPAAVRHFRIRRVSR